MIKQIIEPDYAESQRPKPGSGEFSEFAKLYGKIELNKIGRTDLNFYRYENKLETITEFMKEQGYEYYLAGGKHGRPDLKRKNYETGFLMIYDPTDQKGRIAFSNEYAIGYSIMHELGHAKTLKQLNEIYGEGRRLGALGKHRTKREALRALHWEILTLSVQRELSEEVGIYLTDEDYEKDRNGVLGEATMRAISGRFTEPNNEGFYPHSNHIEDKIVLDVIHEAADKMGLKGMDDLLLRK